MTMASCAPSTTSAWPRRWRGRPWARSSRCDGGRRRASMHACTLRGAVRGAPEGWRHAGACVRACMQASMHAGMRACARACNTAPHGPPPPAGLHLQDHGRPGQAGLCHEAGRAHQPARAPAHVARGPRLPRPRPPQRWVRMPPLLLGRHGPALLPRRTRMAEGMRAQMRTDAHTCTRAPALPAGPRHDAQRCPPPACMAAPPPSAHAARCRAQLHAMPHAPSHAWTARPVPHAPVLA